MKTQHECQLIAAKGLQQNAETSERRARSKREASKPKQNKTKSEQVNETQDELRGIAAQGAERARSKREASRPK